MPAATGAVNDSDVRGKPIVSASLPTLSLDLLEAGSKVESARLLDACRTYGFFYLDLSTSKQMLEDWEALLDFAGKYFAQPRDVKMKDARQSDTNGYERMQFLANFLQNALGQIYEPVGTSAGAYLNEVDAYESLKVSEGEMRNGVTTLSTALARSQTELFFRFIRSSRAVTLMLLGDLSNSLKLTGASRLERLHSEASPSLSTMSMFRYPKHDAGSGGGVGHNKHTDLGTFTFLLARQWGLQILSPDTESWAFVKPQPEQALVNVGDSLRMATGASLAAVVHRVLPVGEMQLEDRYSIAYFLRMDDEVEIPVQRQQKDSKTAESTAAVEVWNARKWHNYKFDVFRAPLDSANGLKDLTGGMEKDDRLIV